MPSMWLAARNLSVVADADGGGAGEKEHLEKHSPPNTTKKNQKGEQGRGGYDDEERNSEPFLDRLDQDEENNSAEREMAEAAQTDDSSNLKQMYEID